LRRLAALCCVWLALALPGFAQDEDADRGFLQGLIEDSLSGAGREVRIEGFEGALSSQARLDRMTIADADGVWLVLENAVLDWNRSALLRGRLEVQALTAESLQIERLPSTAAPENAVGVALPDLPTPEAQPFSVPDLPVALNVDRLAIDRVSLGETVLGEPVALAVEGSANLEGGEGSAALTVQRLDGPEGRFALEAAFSNETRILDLLLALEEDAGGIAATLIGLPGAPPLSLEIEGADPIDDFTADIALETEGEPRLTGTATLRAPVNETARFALDIDGDIRPLVDARFHAFFGESVSLDLEAQRPVDGGLVLDRLALDARAVQLRGELALGADGWPTRIDLTGRIAQDGGDVLLALPGAETRIDGADLAVQYDAAAGETWTAEITIANLRRPGMTVASADLSGQGALQPGEGTLVGRASGRLELDINGIALDDPALAEAVGQRLDGALQFDLAESAALSLSDISLRGAHYALTGRAELAAPVSDLDAAVDAELTAPELEKFAALVGRPLTGQARLDISGTARPLDGTFDLDVAGSTANLGVGIDRLDPLLAGNGQVDLSAERDAEGIEIDRLVVRTAHAAIEGSAVLTSENSALRVAASIADTGLVAPEMSGPADVTLSARQAGADWDVTLGGSGPGGATLSLTGTAAIREGILAAIDAEVEANADSIAPYGWIAGRDLAGSVALSADGRADLLDGAVSGTLTGTTADIETGIDRLDPLLAGPGEIALTASRDADGIVLDRFALSTGQASVSGSGALRAEDSEVRLTARLENTALVAPEMSGPANLTLAAQQRGDDWDVTLGAEGPGGVALSADGTAALADGMLAAVAGEVTASADSIAPYGWIAGQDLAGSVNLSGSGEADLRDGSASGALEGSALDLETGIAAVDVLLNGRTTVASELRRTEDGVIVFDRLDLRTPVLVADVTGSLGAVRSYLRFNLDLADIGLYTPDLSGPVAAEGTAASDGGDWTVQSALTGPGGTRANVSGTVAPDASLANLAIDGTGPLALINSFIAPRLASGPVRFDLSLNGPLAVTSLSGTVSTSDASLSLPTLRLALGGIDATARIASGRAQVQAGMDVSSGGRIALSGGVSLSPPFSADLSADLTSVGIVDPGLYETTVSGQVTATGPLAGGARIAGALALGPVEVRIPSGTAADSEAVPGLVHVGEPADVRRTRARAGLLGQDGAGAGGTGGGGGGPVYPLDLRIDATNRIFIRGRGLDAELGGSLRLTGTTQAVAPDGRFDLVRGRLDILGQRLVLDEGYARLQGDFDPFVRLVAVTDAGDLTVRVILEGPISAPELTISSSPELPEDEILSRLLFGRDLSEISALQAVRIAAAVNTLAGGGGGIVSGLRDRFGLDDLDIATSDTGATELTVGKYLGENLYSDVTVDSQGQSEINLNLEITPSITARGSVGSDGGTGIGIFIERDY
jgi:translocation and assembly module TamB